MSYLLRGLPSDMLTSDRERFRRLRVDIAQTGFFEGHLDWEELP